ncbi:hypothetical protein [Mycobacterium sp. AZCC_0083]|uniref:hypothetical protein n=1 Tax=Mycobacterium sp. AZCC_0083 TaxID=2735882 RepID=UPI001C84D728|nr:hypothetical protein [Mycobacterium sp. AZCC_0083]
MTTAEQYRALCDAADAPFVHIATPAGATTTSHWSRSPEDNGMHVRDLEWWEKWCEDHTVAITGGQYSDGSVDRHIAVFDDDNGKITVNSAANARELAAALLEAAELMDGAP